MTREPAGGSCGHLHNFVDVLPRGDLVGGFVLTIGRTELHLDLQRDVVQLSAVLALDHAGRVADCGQLLVTNFLCGRVGVAQVQTAIDLLTLHRASDDVVAEFQIRTVAVVGRFHFAGVNDDVIPTCWNGVL